MKKREYMKPDVQVFELKKEQMLLMSSPNTSGSRDDYGTRTEW